MMHPLIFGPAPQRFNKRGCRRLMRRAGHKRARAYSKQITRDALQEYEGQPLVCFVWGSRAFDVTKSARINYPIKWTEKGYRALVNGKWVDIDVADFAD